MKPVFGVPDIADRLQTALRHLVALLDAMFQRPQGRQLFQPHSQRLSACRAARHPAKRNNE